MEGRAVEGGTFVPECVKTRTFTRKENPAIHTKMYTERQDWVKTSKGIRIFLEEYAYISFTAHNMSNAMLTLFLCTKRHMHITNITHHHKTNMYNKSQVMIFVTFKDRKSKLECIKQIRIPGAIQVHCCTHAWTNKNGKKGLSAKNA